MRKNKANNIACDTRHSLQTQATFNQTNQAKSILANRDTQGVSTRGVATVNRAGKPLESVLTSSCSPRNPEMNLSSRNTRRMRTAET